MYHLIAYGRMIQDTQRAAAYADAIARTVGADSIVLDIGAGTGFLTLLACRAGARRVFAVETSADLEIARQIVRANGYADRVEFFEGDSTRLTLPARADVIVSDLRAVLPLGLGGERTLIDARERLLRPGGVLIPQRDRIIGAVGAAPRTYATLTEPWRSSPGGFDMSAAARAAVNVITPVREHEEVILSDAAPCIDIDYTTVATQSFAGALGLVCHRPGTAHGLSLWFETTLVEGVGFETAPSDSPSVYGRALLPWPEPVACEVGTRVDAVIRADVAGGERIWTWKTYISHPAGGVQRFRQSTFGGPGWSADRLRRRSAAYVPSPGPEAEILGAALALMQEELSLGEIARRLRVRFPGAFADEAEALERAADVAEQCGR